MFLIWDRFDIFVSVESGEYRISIVESGEYQINIVERSQYRISIVEGRQIHRMGFGNNSTARSTLLRRIKLEPVWNLGSQIENLHFGR